MAFRRTKPFPGEGEDILLFVPDQKNGRRVYDPEDPDDLSNSELQPSPPMPWSPLSAASNFGREAKTPAHAPSAAGPPPPIESEADGIHEVMEFSAPGAKLGRKMPLPSAKRISSPRKPAPKPRPLASDATPPSRPAPIERADTAPNPAPRRASPAAPRDKATPPSGPASGAKAPRKKKDTAPDPGDKETRQMFDKRTLRRDNAVSFLEGVEAWKASPAGSESILSTAPKGSKGQLGRTWLRSFVRKRPLFDRERAKGEFDVITVPLPGAPSEDAKAAPKGRGKGAAAPPAPPPQQLTAHLCLHEADLKRMFIRHMTFAASAVFSETVTNPEVYASAAAGLVTRATQGGVCTLFSFGQTGSGKTHTCDAIEAMAAEQVFRDAAAAAQEDGQERVVHVSFVELAGRAVLDLLANAPGERAPTGADASALSPIVGGKRELALLDDADGRTLAVGAAYMRVRSSAELLAHVKLGKSLRHTEETQMNATSSRSHAVLRIVVGPPPKGLAGAGDSDGREDSPTEPPANGKRAPSPRHVASARGASPGAGRRKASPGPAAKRAASPRRAGSNGRTPPSAPRAPAGRKPLSGVAPSRFKGELPRPVDGQLVLVDCAGTERKEDSAKHTADRRREGAEINSSLHALKECLRAIAAMEKESGRPSSARAAVHVPYRASTLTRILSDSFTDPRALVSVLATVSPGCSDTEHSVHTLRTVAAMCKLDGFTKESRTDVGRSSNDMPPPPPPHPKDWVREQICEWLTEVEGGRFAAFADNVPASMDGKLLTRMPKPQFSYRLCGGDQKKGDQLFDALKAEIERVAELKRDYQQQNRDLNNRAKSVGT